MKMFIDYSADSYPPNFDSATRANYNDIAMFEQECDNRTTEQWQCVPAYTIHNHNIYFYGARIKQEFIDS